jgi:hypothetical protein
MPRFSLRTLIVVMLLAPLAIAAAWWLWELKTKYIVLIIGIAD